VSSIALAASLVQAGVAVAVVYAGVAVLGWTRDQTNGVAENIMAPAGMIAIAGVGLWLMWRGFRGMRRAWAVDMAAGHQRHQNQNQNHDHVHDDHCGHAHGPSLDEVSKLTGRRDTAALIAGIAVRPCSGALFLLILTWQLGIGLAGIAGTFAMGLGTALVTIGVALQAVWAREGALASLPMGRVARVLPLFEMAAGALVAAIALSLLTQSL